MTPDEVNHSQAGNVFMLGVGGICGMCLALSVTPAARHTDMGGM